AGIFQPVDVTSRETKAARVQPPFWQRDIFKLAAIEHRLQPLRRADRHVVVRAWDDELIGLDVLVKYKLPGLRTLDPEIFRRLTAQETADLRPYEIGDPVHGSFL